MSEINKEICNKCFKWHIFQNLYLCYKATDLKKSKICQNIEKTIVAYAFVTCLQC